MILSCDNYPRTAPSPERSYMIWPHCSTPDVALRAVAVDVLAFVSVDSRQADRGAARPPTGSWLVSRHARRGDRGGVSLSRMTGRARVGIGCRRCRRRRRAGRPCRPPCRSRARRWARRRSRSRRRRWRRCRPGTSAAAGHWALTLPTMTSNNASVRVSNPATQGVGQRLDVAQQPRQHHVEPDHQLRHGSADLLTFARSTLVASWMSRSSSPVDRK